MIQKYCFNLMYKKDAKVGVFKKLFI